MHYFFSHYFWATLFGGIAAGWIVQAARATRGMLRVPHLTDSLPVSDAGAPSISVIFAARNEAEQLPGALATLLTQDYPRYEVVAVNDRSEDATGDILRQLARTSNRLNAIDVAALPPRWMGKPHALALGAAAATGEWLVFTDADVHFAPDILRRAVRLAGDRRWDHLTLLSGFEMKGFWETALLTYFTVGFVFGNEPWLAANPRSRRYVGIGAFQMLRRTVYDAIGGHGALAMEVIEDMKLGKLVKRGGFRSGLGLAEESIRLRWYVGVWNIVRGLTKNMFAALDFSVWEALAGTLLTLTGSVAPFAGLAFATGPARLFAGVAVTAILAYHAGISLRTKVSPWYAFTHPIGATIFAYIILRSMAVTLARGGIIWRGTFYPLDQLRRGSV